MLSRLTSSAILSSPLATTVTYQDPDTKQTTQIRVVFHYQMQRWQGHTAITQTEVSYLKTATLTLNRRGLLIMADGRAWEVTEEQVFQGGLTQVAVKPKDRNA